jgi:hypothetical protein
MPQSPKIQTKLVCRYFIESCKIFTASATITDVISLVISRWKYGRNDSVSLFPSVNHQFLFFLPIELVTEHGITNERYFDGCIPSMNSLVKMLSTKW